MTIPEADDTVLLDAGRIAESVLAETVSIDWHLLSEMHSGSEVPSLTEQMHAFVRVCEGYRTGTSDMQTICDECRMMTEAQKAISNLSASDDEHLQAAGRFVASHWQSHWREAIAKLEQAVTAAAVNIGNQIVRDNGGAALVPCEQAHTIIAQLIAVAEHRQTGTQPSAKQNALAEIQDLTQRTAFAREAAGTVFQRAVAEAKLAALTGLKIVVTSADDRDDAFQAQVVVEISRKINNMPTTHSAEYDLSEREHAGIRRAELMQWERFSDWLNRQASTNAVRRILADYPLG